MKYFSTFSGIGGFELGIQLAYEDNQLHKKAGVGNKTSYKKRGNSQHNKTSLWKSKPVCVGYSEIDKYATQIYQRHFSHKNYGDITKINERDLPDFDLFVGGFPCQSFSIAGKRKGFKDTRGTLFFDIARIVKEKQPRLLLLENVKGLLSHDQGRTFVTIISTLDELGYDCQWQVLNSKNHGVPQNRERVFIVGHLRGTRRPEVFPFGNEFKEIEKIRVKTSRQKRSSRNSESKDRRTSKRREISTAIDANYHKGIDQHGQKTFATEPKIRKLTPTECERLQGFPDNWTEYGAKEPNGLNNYNSAMNLIEISDTQRYKTLGNAVTVNVIRDIMMRIL